MLSSIILSPDYEQDGTILVGNAYGWAYYSDDDAGSFKPLPASAISAPLSGSISVAFDTSFATNKFVYAASNTADKGVFRFKIGSSTRWESIDSALPSGGKIEGVTLSRDGVLYAANSKSGAGMERSLDPTYSLGPAFESVTSGLVSGATLSGLWIQGTHCGR